jgi:hypothetical protein
MAAKAKPAPKGEVWVMRKSAQENVSLFYSLASQPESFALNMFVLINLIEFRITP